MDGQLAARLLLREDREEPGARTAHSLLTWCALAQDFRMRIFRHQNEGTVGREFDEVCRLSVYENTWKFRGRKVYEPPRYMTCAEAATQLLEIVKRKEAEGIKSGKKSQPTGDDERI